MLIPCVEYRINVNTKIPPRSRLAIDLGLKACRIPVISLKNLRRLRSLLSCCTLRPSALHHSRFFRLQIRFAVLLARFALFFRAIIKRFCASLHDMFCRSTARRHSSSNQQFFGLFFTTPKTCWAALTTEVFSAFHTEFTSSHW